MKHKQSISRLALTAVLLTAVTVLPANAQYASSGGSISNRLERIERDITTLSQQVYNGKSKTAPVQSYGTDSGASASLLANVQIRLDDMDNTVRRLNGVIEEQTYQIQQLQEQLTKMQNDNEMRFQSLENNAVPVQMAPAPQQQQKPFSYNSGNLAPDETATPPSTTPPQTQAIGSGNATLVYDKAFGYIRSGDYADAERAFTNFLSQFPSDKLAANAEYWLGETYYVRGQYDKSASAFARGYQNHPKSSKASDNLLKLALSLGALKRKDDACLALVQLETDFPKATQALRDRVNKEKMKLGCP